MTTVITDAIPGDAFALQSGIGFEPAGRAVRLRLFTLLNGEIDTQAAKWGTADLAMQEIGMDEGVGQVDMLHVQPGNFHEGPHKSLIEAPPEMFPNVSAMAYMTVPAADQSFDQLSSSEITIFVEAMAISGPVPNGMEVAHETIVHRRIQRMTEAVAIVLESDQTLLGTVHQLRTPPRGGIGVASWLRPQKSGAGEKYIWHGSRLQYTAIRHHT